MLAAPSGRLRPAVNGDRLWRNPLTDSRPADLTNLLKAWSDGDKEALDELIPVVYAELHRLAHAYLRRETTRKLQTTELVNEAYVQLVRQEHVRWQNRAHFFGISAQLMRRILAEQARTRKAAKRGGGVEPAAGVDAGDLDEALQRLTLLDARQGQLVELRFFGGLSIEEAAEVMKLSPATLKREWSTARARLKRELSPPG